MLIVSFSFGFGGMLLIQYSYQASIKQEKRAARNSYEMILRMLKEINEMDDTYQNQTFASVLKRLNWQGLLRDSSVRLLKEQHGEVQWKQPLYYNRKNDNFRRSNGFSTKQGKAVVFQNKNKVYYQITSKISYGKETMVFQGAYDISEVYATRHQQLVSFRKIFVLVIGIEIVVSYFLAMILTRPLQKLSQVSKQIADGDYSVRVPVHTEDEIGELSVSFNYMTEQLIEKLMKLDQLLKNQEEFMGSFAHEMKTPLTSIIGYADLMRMEALSKEEQKEACGYIYSEGKRLQNLSLKSMNSGGILTVEDRATQEGAKIYISDTGCGMPKDEISKITEAFYRIDKSRSRKQGGVGLGLAICKEIVRIHQGEMRFISQQGKGTTVIITIGGGAYEKTN
jgi:signal transduction histidine kinase